MDVVTEFVREGVLIELLYYDYFVLMSWKIKELSIKVFGLNEAIDQLSMSNSVCWYVHMLNREDGCVLKKALDFEVVS